MSKYPDSPQYINYEPDTKTPVSPQGLPIDAHDPANWMSYDAARATGCPVGFVLTENDPYFLLDVDKQRDPVTGEWSYLARDISAQFAGAGQEISQSRNGFHVIGVCDQALLADRRNKWDGCLEFYTKGRYIALNPDLEISGNVTLDCTDQLMEFVPVRESEISEMPDDGPVDDYTGPEDDDELIRMMLASRGSAGAQFGDKASVQQLWDADGDALSRFFPPFTDASPYDRSSADAALMSHLAFWTGKDQARMDRIFRRSGLMREKYEKRKDYRTSTIRGAATACRSVYSVPRNVALPVGDAPGPTGEYLAIDQQIERFNGCVYIASIKRILTPFGEFYDKEQFDDMFGGSEFQMSIDGSRPTKKASEAFIQNRAHRFPKVRDTYTSPYEPFGTVRDDKINIMKLPLITGTNDDASPYTNLVSMMIPDERDRRIFLSWCAAMVQSPGVKFQWAVALQGAQGNGKSFLMQALIRALGEEYCHQPIAEDMNEKYNGYLEGNLFIGVDEVHMEGRRSLMDRLKRYITDERVEIREMGQNKRMSASYANWMFTTNHKDAILKSKDDRRFAIFFTAQQTATDVRRDMGGEFFPVLWDWARRGGFNAITGFLLRYEVDPEFDPRAGCHRAPLTSTTNEAIAESLGSLEQEILEAVGAELPGFRGGWISSFRLTEYLKDRNFRRISPRVIKEALAALGYHPCELWRDGRCGALVQEGGARPRLYHTAAIDPSDVSDYIEAQGYST